MIQLPPWLRIVILSVLVAAWLVTGAFVAIIGVSVARGPRPAAPIADVHAAAVTAGYSLGTALLLLGATWPVLPRDRRALVRVAVLWVGVTALLLGTRQVSGWPLFVAAVVAFGIALDVIRRLGATAGILWRTRRRAVVSSRDDE
jgi:hypothetical protein